MPPCQVVQLTYGYGPHRNDFQEGFGSGVEAAMVNGVLDSHVAVQGDAQRCMMDAVEKSTSR